MANQLRSTHISTRLSTPVISPNQDPDSVPEDMTFHFGENRTFFLNPYVYDDLRVPVDTVSKFGIRDPDWVLFGDDHILLSFDALSNPNAEEECFFTAQLPHSYAEGTNLKPHVHWVGSDTNAGNVRWKLSYRWANIDEAFPINNSIYVEGANSSTENYHNLTEFADIDGTGKKISSMIVCRLSRNSSHENDTYESPALLLEFDFHFELNNIGSRQELIK